MKCTFGGTIVGNQVKAALAIVAVVLVVAFAFTAYYFANGLYQRAHPLDAVLVILWVIVAAALLVVFRARALSREEVVRRIYLSKDWVYNFEIGYAPLDEVVPDRDSYEIVLFAADALARMSYGFDVAHAPEDFEPTHMLSSMIFKYHLVGEDVDDEDKSVVIDQWRGTLQKITRTESDDYSYESVGSFSNAKELARLLDANDVLKKD